MEWVKFGVNTYTNEARTVVKAHKVSDLPKRLAFYDNLELLDNFGVVSTTEGKGIIKELINKKSITVSSKKVFKITSKFGNTSYFDVELVKPLVTDSSMFYLPYAEEKDGIQLDAPLVITDTDVIYVVLPYQVDEFIEDVSLDEWI